MVKMGQLARDSSLYFKHIFRAGTDMQREDIALGGERYLGSLLFSYVFSLFSFALAYGSGGVRKCTVQVKIREGLVVGPDWKKLYDATTSCLPTYRECPSWWMATYAVYS